MERRVNPEVGFRDLKQGLTSLDIPEGKPILAHASLSSFGWVRGGAETVVDTLLQVFKGVMMPAFTYRTMLIPETGPPDNGLVYGSGRDLNRMALRASPELPADRLMGAVSEALRRHRRAERSSHPILSFTGVNVQGLLASQSIEDPLGPVHALIQAGGWVLLLGVGHSVNTALHYAEQLAGRRQFVRWALMDHEVVACPHFPGCSNGFVELSETLAPLAREVLIGRARVRGFPAAEMAAAAAGAFEAQPRGYLCKRIDCGRCNAVRGRGSAL